MLPFVFIFAYCCAWYGVSRFVRNNSIIDIAWGLGFVGFCWLHLLTGVAHWSLSHYLLAGAVTVWGLRLSIHIGYRNWLKGAEDWRYANWRAEWGSSEPWRALLQIYLLQGFFMAIIALPIWCCPAEQSAFVHPLWLWVRFLGFLGFFVGFLYESVADWQLLQFSKSVRLKGTILQTGLWKYSRHPNYFGEILVWWGIFLMAFPYGNLPVTLLALLSPLTITWLLRRVSGVPMLEKRWAQDPEYAAYVARTNALLPDFFE